MAYDIDIQYVKGKDNHLADPLSRSYLPHQVTGQQEFEAIHSVCDLCLPEDKLADLKRATADDETMPDPCENHTGRVARTQITGVTSCDIHTTMSEMNFQLMMGLSSEVNALSSPKQ